MEKERLILPTSRILPSTVPQRHIFSVTMRESVQLEIPTAFTRAFASAIDGYTDFEAAKEPEGSAKDYLIRLGNLLPEETSTAERSWHVCS